MAVDPASAVTLGDDLPRAVAYGQWASKFSNNAPPEGLTEFGAWGHVARWLATKGSKDFTLRTVGVTNPDLLYNALVTEPSRNLGYGPTAYAAAMGHLGPNARGGQNSLRGMLVWGINQSADKLPTMWSSNPTRLVVALARAIELDPDPMVRLEILKLVNGGSYPVMAWANAFIPAIERGQATLAEAPFSTGHRQALQKLYSDAKARLLTLLAQAQAGQLPGYGSDYLAPPVSSFPWLLALGIVGGLGAAAAGSYALWRRRRSSGAAPRAPRARRALVA